jgi:hypothetical protein
MLRLHARHDPAIRAGKTTPLRPCVEPASGHQSRYGRGRPRSRHAQSRLKRNPFARIAVSLPGDIAVLWSTKGVDDAKPTFQRYAVLHILGPESVAIGAQRRGGDHRVIDRQSVTLGDRQPRFVNLDRKRLHRQQAPDGP